MAAPVPDITLLRRSCAPCTLRQFCQHVGLPQRTPGSALGKPFGVNRGDSLFRAGDQHGRVYAVRTGAMKTVAVTADGEEHVLGFHLPGELLPTIAGSVPPLGARGDNCLFASRCPRADARCQKAPPLMALDGNTNEQAACWYAHAA